MMNLRLLDHFSSPGTEVNEDAFGLSNSLAWMLDGATGLQSERLLPGASDASWLVGEIGACLEQLRNPEELHSHLAELQARLVNRFARALEQPLDSPEAPEGPSASMCVVQLSSACLTAANIGDCRLFIRPPDGEVHAFGHSPVSQMDAEVVRALKMLQQQEASASHRELWLKLIPMIRRNRTLKNRPEGYWVVSPTESWTQYVQYGQFTIHEGMQILLMTDGFYRLVDTYALYDHNSLFSSALESGLQVLGEELRHVEATDRECRKHPRIKPEDDATALLLEVR